MTAEVWKPVVGHEGVYEVSSEGNVKRVAPGRGTHVGRVLNPMTDHKGYLYVRFDGRMQRIHRLVLAAFVGPSEMLCRGCRECRRQMKARIRQQKREQASQG